MGCDIHPHFETQQPDGTWALTWRRHPAQWWMGKVISAKVEDGSAQTIFGLPDEEEAAVAMEEYLFTLSNEELLERYDIRMDDDWVHWEYFPRASGHYYGNTKDYRSYTIRERNYEWFSHLAGVRGDKPLFGPRRGLPPDMSPEVSEEAHKQEGHSPSWLMCSEILANNHLAGFAQYHWIEKWVPEPDKTRMVFWFDS